MNLVIEEPVTVITPSIGNPKLADAIKSVQAQTYPTKHLIVADGNEAFQNVLQISVPLGDPKVVCTPERTGDNGFNGQRIYAAYPHLINSEYILFLDEDNWYEPNHVETLITTIRSKNLDFAYSLRKIHSPEGGYLCNDDCESLGKWEIYLSRHSSMGNQYLIDTSAYCFKRDFIRYTCHLWHSGAWGEDRRYLNAIRGHSRFDTSGEYTLCYRLDGNPKSVTEEFFEVGNKTQMEYYGGRYPWRKI